MVRNFKDQFSLHFSRPSTYLIPKAGCYYCYISKVLPKLLQRVNTYRYVSQFAEILRTTSCLYSPTVIFQTE